VDSPIKKPVLDNVGCLFEPYVLGVVAGQEFEIRNSDSIMHNVHATGKLNKEFNFAMPHKGQVNRKRFNVPEVFVRVKCDVHPWMFAYIGVVENPFFAVTEKAGTFKIPGRLRAGKYTLVAAHPRAGEAAREIVVAEGQPLAVNFHLAVPVPPQVNALAPIRRLLEP
jgi:hypothetical protein